MWLIESGSGALKTFPFLSFCVTDFFFSLGILYFLCTRVLVFSFLFVFLEIKYCCYGTGGSGKNFLDRRDCVGGVSMVTREFGGVTQLS